MVYLRRLLYAIGLVLVVVVGFYALVLWQFSDRIYPEDLLALQHDPMAFYEPPGIELLDRRERDAMDTWKSYQGASIDQRFEIGRDALARAAMDQAVAAAQRNGWFLEELDQTDASFCKHAMTLRITWYDFEEPNQLRVAVGGSAGFTDCGI